MLDQEIYLEQCVGIRRAGGHASCVGGCVGELFSQSTSFSAPINGGLKKKKGSSALANFKFLYRGADKSLARIDDYYVKIKHISFLSSL